ncbi:MAG: ATP-dependent Clp protease ATP-binding subunit [Armatimonadetes bacterium]|nr:ATP-dependent Clp protease ATP-binding subunit [Armatimonadota bacterium]
MAVHRFPVVMWKDPAGGTTATLLENESVAGYAESPPDALEQVRDYLQWLYAQQPTRLGSLVSEPKLARFKVKVRPEYEADGKIYAYDRSLTLHVACVHCQHSSGLRAASLPGLQVSFLYSPGASLRDLVRHYVQERFAHMTPHEISRSMPPQELVLEEVSIKTPRPAPVQTAGPDLRQLETVADAIGTRAFRRAYHPAYEREREVEELARRLSAEKTNVLLLGSRGAGKTAVLVEAVRRLERRKTESHRERLRLGLALGGAGGSPRTSASHRFWMTRGSRIIAGMKYLGQWEQRCETVLGELSRIAGVLCAESALELIQTGGAGPQSSVASFLVPYLEQAELQMVAETTPEELQACRRLLPQFIDLFGILCIEALTGPEAIAVLERVAEAAGPRRRLSFGQGVVDEIYRLHRRFLPYHGFPGRAVSFLDQLVERHQGPERLSRQEVTEHFSRQSGLPRRFLRDEEPLPPAEIGAYFEARVVGQEEACRTVTDLVSTFKAGLNDPERPLGVFLFCGPTGVGKTEMAKAVADYFFGAGEDRDRMVRLDMSEYSGFAASERLLGDELRPGELVRRVRRQPFVVVLLDEIEKAHPDVYDVLLSVFDEGRLTDAYGRTTTFRSAVLIMTSNLGAESLRPLGFSQRATPSYESEAMGFFRPEFFNRIDAVVRFEPLQPEHIRRIARKELAALERREGLARRKVRLRWSEAVVERLAELGYDARYGARPLKRVLEEQVVIPLARHLVENPRLSGSVVELELDERGEVRLR